MGYLYDNYADELKKIPLSEYYKNNTIYMYNAYNKPNEFCYPVNISDIVFGDFYFLYYKDDSNWMKYSPIFTIEHKKFKGLDILISINLNFVPIELRVKFFDQFLSENDVINDKNLKVDFKGVYTQLLKIGFEYGIVEYNIKQIVHAYKINKKILNSFLVSSHPKNKYDPNKLMDIWQKKIKDKEKRHQEIIKATLSDFYSTEEAILNKYNVLSSHIKRIQKSINKYG